MGTIVAIGGGQVFVPCQPPTTLRIDKEIVRLGRERSNRRSPRFLFVPTASSDDLLYCHGVYNIYEARLGCQFDHLRIMAEKLSDRQITKKINWADVIYVGGGNILKMMNAWRRRGVDKLLIEAYKEGKVMCGLSAGAICWFEWGVSDSLKKKGQDEFKPIRASGLGILPQAICPHWDSEGGWRKSAFPRMLVISPSYQELGLALEDDCAFELTDSKMRFISSVPGKRAYRLWWEREAESIRLRQKLLPCTEEFRRYHFGFLRPGD